MLLHSIPNKCLFACIALLSWLSLGLPVIANSQHLSQGNNAIISLHTKKSAPFAANSAITFLDKHSNTLIRALTAAIAIEILFINGSATNKEALLKQLTPPSLLKNLCLNYTKSLLVTTGHESGHALAAHYLTNSPINIHIGKNSTDEAGISLKLSGISFDGINPDIGYSIYNTPIKDPKALVKTVNKHIVEFCKKNNREIPLNSPQELESIILEIYAGKNASDSIITSNTIDTKKMLAISIAGGLTGLLVNYSIKLATAYATKTDDQSIFTKALALDYQDIQQLLNLLMPIGTCGKGESDAIKIYRSLGIPEELINSFSQLELTPSIDFLASLGLEVAQANNTSNLQDLIGMALLNMSTRGFLRFKLP